jgi:CheY-like chemotaxis protein
VSKLLSRARVTHLREPQRTRRARPSLGERGREAFLGPRTGRFGERRRSGEPAGSPRGAGGGSSARDTSGGRILIVDDETAIRLVCRLNLQTAGFETLEAGDGESALSLARAERPDLILLDIMLPEVDGWGVAAELAAGPETRDIPFLFMTARSDRIDESRGHEAGAVGYITKPFDPAVMAETVRTVLERARRGESDAMRREWERALRYGDD